MGKIPQIIFRGIVEKGKIHHDHPQLFQGMLDSLEGRRFEMTINTERKPKTLSQLGYYFGGIIEATCMTSNVFDGWTKEEIHEYLMSKLRSYSKEVFYPDGHREVITCRDRLEDYDLEQTSKYIDQVVIFLSTFHGLTPLGPNDYKYEKYIRIIK